MLEHLVRISFEAPFIMGSGHGRAGIFDHTTILDGRGRAYIPGSSLKGRLRHWCHRIICSLAQENVTDPLDFNTLCPAIGDRFCRGSVCAFCRLFGSPVHQGEYRFEDGALSSGMDVVDGFTGEERLYTIAAQTEGRTRIAIDRQRAVARSGHLFSYEHGAPYLGFNARITGPEDEQVRVLLEYSCRCLTHLGGGASVGLGRCSMEGNRS
jgi:CRISPR/Cas system CSM-associated protein Csm3 (group 7 of RAMP superfamily)